MEKFVHLHNHTEYSLLDGAARIKKLVKVAKEYGMPAVAITDHGNMYGAVQFFDACKEQGIKPIIGCEFYTTDDIQVKSGKVKLNHLILLAKNEEGYKNLCLLNTIAFRDGFYYKPRIDHEALKKHSSGLICLSACLAGEIPQLILQNRFDEAEQTVLWFKNLFGEDYYLELQNHGLLEQQKVNEKLKEFAKKYNIKTVATNDAHYIYKEDAEMQDVLMCVQMGKTVDDPDRMKFPCDEFYFKTYDEMLKAFPNDKSALETTLEIADKCNFEFVYGKYLYPKYVPRTGQTSKDFFRELIENGLKRRYKNPTQEIRDRIEYEFGIIERLGYIDYYLIVWDYINAAREKGISVGPGRGSGVGSIVAYLIGITNVDPIKYGLFFERFLNPERVSAPDFDIDFEDSRRSEVFDYVKEKYGEERVVKIITFGTMAAKNAIKDVGRVLKVPYSELDKVTKAIPNSVKRPNIIAKCFGLHQKEGAPDESIPELKEIYKSNPEIKKVIDLADKLEDSPRQTGIHACGVIIGGDILDRHLPLAKNGEDMTTQFVGGELEHLGHLKMDFLGLRNLSDIQQCIALVKKNHGVEINFDDCAYDDPNVFKLISTGNTKGIFQIESAGFQKFMKELQPTCLEDIIAGVSLYRPGPMDSIPNFVKNKHNPEGIKYVSPVLEPILNVTYGCIVYQEQVMKIVQELAGYSLSRADSVRKMMGKKKVAEIQKEREVFLNGCPPQNGKSGVDGVLKRGVDPVIANKLWDEMEKFGSYAFNKSHAAAYSCITYQTAYLKTYYEIEFLTSLLNNRITNSDEIKNYINYAKEEKINVLSPDINKSETYFSVENGNIRFGLGAIKNVGISLIDSIIEERNTNGEFKDFSDFIKRVNSAAHNKKCLESLILAGAFDCFGKKRSQLMSVYDIAVSREANERKKKASGQFSLFDVFEDASLGDKLEYPDIKEFSKDAKLKFEKEVVGIYISGNPLDDYLDKYKEFNLTSNKLVPVEEDEEFVDDNAETKVEYEYELQNDLKVVCGGILSDCRKLITKNGNREMGFAQIEDPYGTIDVMFFPDAYRRFKNVFVDDTLVTIKGRLSIREGEKPIVVVEDLLPWQTQEKVQQVEEVHQNLYLKFDTTNIELYNKIVSVLADYVGESEVFVRCSCTGKAFKMNKKVSISNHLENELCGILSEDSIVIK